jgi:hypothetical protein
MNLYIVQMDCYLNIVQMDAGRRRAAPETYEGMTT